MNPIDRHRKLNEEAGKYNRPEFDEVYKYIWQGLSDEEALRKSGFADDVDFVNDFMKYREIDNEASKIQLETLCEAVQHITHNVSIDEIMQKAGFSKSSELQDILDNIVESETTKNPYFPHPKPFADLTKGNENIDKLLKVDNYHINGALQCYYSLLIDANIEELLGKIGVTLEDLLTILNEITTTIENNTDKPIFLENKIIEILNTLSEYIGCGQVLQILILQGVLSWFEHCDINEGDDGYAEAYNLYKRVYKKQVEVCCLYFTAFEHNKDSEPLDALLAKTEIGQTWERCINNDNTPTAPPQPQQASNNKEILKTNLNTSQIELLYSELVAAQFIPDTDKDAFVWTFGGEMQPNTNALLRWNKNDALLVYLIHILCHDPYKSSNYWAIGEKAFGIKDMAKKRERYYNNKMCKPKGYEIIDRIIQKIKES